MSIRIFYVEKFSEKRKNESILEQGAEETVWTLQGEETAILRNVKMMKFIV